MYCMMSMLGTIITACFFMPSIIVSMLLGSNGDAGPSPSPSGLGLRYFPDAKSDTVALEKAWYCTGWRGDSGAEARRSCARPSARLELTVFRENKEYSLFPHCRAGLRFGRRVHEQGDIVSQDAHEHHDDRDGDEHPVLGSVRACCSTHPNGRIEIEILPAVSVVLAVPTP